MKKLALLCGLILMSTPLMADDVLQIAVFNPTGIEDNDIIEISREIVIEALVNNPSFVLLDRETVDEVLQENRFQANNGVSDEQIRSMGQKMGADAVAITLIKKTGTSYFVSIKIVDVVTTKAIYAATMRHNDTFVALDGAIAKLINTAGGSSTAGTNYVGSFYTMKVDGETVQIAPEELPKKYSHGDAVRAIEVMNEYGDYGHNNWRLPTPNELSKMAIYHEREPIAGLDLKKDKYRGSYKEGYMNFSESYYDQYEPHELITVRPVRTDE